MRKLVFVMVCLTSQAHAEVHVGGVGARSCAEFIAQYTENVIEEGIHFTWAQGYMSALNSVQFATRQEVRDLGGWSFEQQRAQVRMYCDRHPTSPYYSAVFSLYTALPVIERPAVHP